MSDNDKKRDAEEKAMKKALIEESGKDWYELTHRNWRAWGSWFSWGSPVGLALFFAIPMVAYGIMHWLMGL